MINECIDLDVYGIVQQICKIELAYCSFSSIITCYKCLGAYSLANMNECSIFWDWEVYVLIDK